MLHHRDLMRDGEIEALKAERPRGAHRVCQLFGRHLDREIAPVQSSGCEPGLLHDAGRILGHRLPEHCH